MNPYFGLKNIKMLVATVTGFVTVACGPQENPNVELGSSFHDKSGSPTDPFSFVAATAGPDTTTGSGIDILKQVVVSDDTTGGTGTAVPAGLPAKGTTVDKIELQFNVKIVDNSPNFQFNYDPKSWTVCAGEGANVYPFSGSEIELESGGENALNQKTSERHGNVRFLIKPSGQKLSDILYNTLSQSPSGRSAIKLQPVYTTDGKCPASVGNNAPAGLVSPIYLQTDVGALSSAPTVTNVAVSEGAFTVSFKAPDDLSATDKNAGGSVSPAGTSSVNAFVVIYWKDDDCKNGGWDFAPNPTFDKNKSALQCSYPGLGNMTVPSGANSCSFGCSGPTDGFFGKTAEEVAIPLTFPNSEGYSNKVNSGCYTAVRVSSSRSSLGVSDLENGKNYGVAVYALDSAGHFGLGHSRCAAIVPQQVPLASSEKTPSIKKTKSDCFVVTAASGSVTSPAVHYWRLLRDKYLDGTEFVKWYMVNGPELAGWLNSHEQFKPTINSILSFSGKTIVETDVAVRRQVKEGVAFLTSRWSEFSLTLKSILQSVFVSEARADEPAPEKSNSTSQGDGLHGSGSSALYFLMGGLKPTEDKVLYDKYYRKRIPLSIIMGQTFRVFDAAGELGIGGELSYLGTAGRVPGSAPADVQNQKIGFYSFGVLAVVDYHWRLVEDGWISPRISLGAGRERFREESDSSHSATQADASASNPSVGVSSWGSRIQIRGSAEISLARFSEDAAHAKFGYGLEDFLFSIYAGYAKTVSKTLSTGGISFGGGIVFLML